jgi:hypothetical protein
MLDSAKETHQGSILLLIRPERSFIGLRRDEPFFKKKKERKEKKILIELKFLLRKTLFLVVPIKP